MKISSIGALTKQMTRLSLSVFILSTGFIFLSVTAAEMPMMSPMKAGAMQGGSAPADARDPNANSGGYEYRGMGGWEDTDEISIRKIIVDQLEYRSNNGSDTLRWDLQGWQGTDYKKFWFKFEGDNETVAKTGELELQTLYSQSISAFWDLQVGARYDRSYRSGGSDNRFFAVIGVQGLAPYWFEVEPALFVSDNGDVSARMVSTYDLLFSQRLILQPRFEINGAASQVQESGIGKGINDIQIGFRLRYEMRRKFAPYMGLSWTKKIGDTADLVRSGGENTSDIALLAGLRLWF